MSTSTHSTVDTTARRIRVGEIELSVIDTSYGADEGSAEPTVLLLHGFPDRATMWNAQIEALSDAGYRVLAPDLRGFGDSDRPEGVDNYTLDKIMGDVIGLLDVLGLDTVQVAGHDWGSGIGWILASIAPERVKRLAAISVGNPRALSGAGFAQKQLSWYQLWWCFEGESDRGMSADDWKWYREWAYNGADRADDAHLERQLRDLERPGALTAGLNYYRANAVDGYAAKDRTVVLPDVTCPTVGVWGDREMALTERQMTDSHKFVDGPWEYHRIEGVGHWIPAHAPERLNEILLGFFVKD